jgi:membrane-bound ClpP family serine protease
MEEEDGLGVKFTRRTKIIVTGLDAIILILILFHFLAADLPNLTTLSNDRLLILGSVFISVTGFIFSFRYDGIGGLIILYGFLLFWIVNFTHNYSYHFEWITAGSPLSGVMHIFVWRRVTRNKTTHY